MTEAPDLLFQEDVREVVRRAYAALPAGGGTPVAERLYRAEDLDRVPQAAIEWALGVGDPVGASDIAAGETVLDVGCGGGIDSILAGRRVGPEGTVIGLDLLPEMCERASSAAAAAGTGGWSRFEVGAMEEVPLPDDSIDVVVTNGVLNLSPRRSRALLELARVLRPGGRLWAADLTVDAELPPEVLGSEAAWAGCIAGAASTDLLRRKLARAGFTDVEIGQPVAFSLDDAAQYPLFTPEALALMEEVLGPQDRAQVATAHLVHARLPEEGHELSEPRAADRSAPAPSGVVAIDDVPALEVEAPGVVVRKLAGVEDADLKVLEVAPDGSTPHHVHLHAHEGVVIAGHGHLRLDRGPQPLRPGDAFRVNPNDRHAIVNDGTEPLRLVCMDCLLE